MSDKERCNQPICDSCLNLIDTIFKYEHGVYEVGIIPKKCAFCENDGQYTLDATNNSFYIICEAVETWHDEKKL